jgi:hypothetical protein
MLAVVALPSWLLTPQMIFTIVFSLILFFVNAGLSLFPSETRAVLKIPIKRIKQSLLAMYEKEIAALELLHDNTYQLVLWGLWSMTSLMKYIGLIIFWTAVLNVALYFIAGRLLVTNILTPFALPIFGSLMGRFAQTSKVIRGLYDYDARTARLKEMIEIIKADLHSKLFPPGLLARPAQPYRHQPNSAPNGSIPRL